VKLPEQNPVVSIGAISLWFHHFGFIHSMAPLNVSFKQEEHSECIAKNTDIEPKWPRNQEKCVLKGSIRVLQG